MKIKVPPTINQNANSKTGIGYVILEVSDPSLMRHKTRELAFEEATRLAKNNPDKQFVILQPQHVVRLDPNPIEVAEVQFGLNDY